MNLKNDKFKREILEFWALKFNVPVENIEKNGTTILEEPELDGSGKIILYDFDGICFVRADNGILSELDLAAGFWEGYLITEEFVKEKADNVNLGIQDVYTLFDYFLDSGDFIDTDFNTFYKPGILNLPEDEKYVKEMVADCSPEEIDNADIYIDELDPVNFGVFSNEHKLIAYSSYRIFGANICDLGVLIHPDYRGQCLAKVVVAELCKYCIRNSVIPMYRVFEENRHSVRVPESLGFRRLLSVQTIIVNQAAQ